MDHEISLCGPTAEDHSMEDRGRIFFEHGRDRVKKNMVAVGSPKSAQRCKDHHMECKIQEKPKTRGVTKRTHWRSKKVFGRRWSTVVCLDPKEKLEFYPEGAEPVLVSSESVYNALKVLGNALADPLRMFFGVGADELRAAGDLFSGHVDRSERKQAHAEPENDQKTGRRISSTADVHHGHNLRPLTIISVHPRLPTELQQEIQTGITLRPAGRLDTHPKLPHDLKQEIHSLLPLPMCKGVIMRRSGKFGVPRRLRTPSPQKEEESDLQHYKRVSAEFRHWEDRNMALESRLAPAAFFLPKLPRRLLEDIRSFDQQRLRRTRNFQPLREETELEHFKRASSELRQYEERMMSLEERLAPPAFFARTLPREVQEQIRNFNTLKLRPVVRQWPLQRESELQHDRRVATELRRREAAMMGLESRLAPVAFFLPKLPHALQEDIKHCSPALLAPTGNLEVRPRLPLDLQMDIRASGQGLAEVKGAGSPALRVACPPVVLRHTGVVSPRPRMREALLYDIRRNLITSLRRAGNLALAPKLPSDLQAEIKRGVALRTPPPVVFKHPTLPGDLKQQIIKGVAWRCSGNLAVRPWLPLALREAIEHGAALRHVGDEDDVWSGFPTPSRTPSLEEHERRQAELRLRVAHDKGLEQKLFQETSGTSPGLFTIHLTGNLGYCPCEGECVCEPAECV